MSTTTTVPPQPPPTPPGLSSLFYSFTRVLSPSSPIAKEGTKIAAPPFDFDAGINTSNAWTEHRERESVALSTSSHPTSPSLSDDEGEEDVTQEDVDGRGARVLHNFEGKPEFRELTAEAGDEIEIIREDAGEGWSLVRNSVGEMGLLPRTYYTVSALRLCPRRSNIHMPLCFTALPGHFQFSTIKFGVWVGGSNKLSILLIIKPFSPSNLFSSPSIF